ncbi:MULTISPECIES: TlpA disulfide reductase family protein [unclassified Microbacterium]|uniref:TlpA family protein disulfide reductase n=1 Tax=unclassified Microbacterium TaxID=2609290 RepID=UPI001604BC63|nr:MULTISPECIES: TlpA disulfide reductase family protein [unclassified Microbacterium]QNA91931.1 TlpA family protein disulfide reductase [Microbacterium sp. Se63.02b]QYM65153.1 TlpA family protein disulfide reductase [Microbacterium sp. Se5.02b]
MPRDSTVSSIRSGRSSRTRPSRRAVGAALAAVLAIGLSACAPDPVSQSFLSGENTGYVAADGAIVEIPVAERGEPVEFGGVTETGEKFDSADIAGQVTVVNFWYAGCAPCRLEAADLEAVWQKFAADDVSFVGINTRDQADTAIAFADEYDITYPSLIDVDTAEAKLAFAKVVPIAATPTTLVLDKQGRVAAKIIGPIDGPSILSTLVKDTLAEDS